MSRKYFRLLTVLVLPVLLQSCSIYSSGFSCPEARGARCAMLSHVDNMIDSGEIETVYQNKKCRSGKCASENENIPKVKK